MHLSRSMVATLAVIGATCALPAITSSGAATPAPRAGFYLDTKAAVNLNVARDRKTVTTINGSCFKRHVQQGDWTLHKRLAISHGTLAFQGLVTDHFDGGPQRVKLTIHAKWEAGRFRGTITSNMPSRCEAVRFAAKFTPPTGE
jgi:hypothetical protein